jgi:hypothetical protein
MTSLSRIKRGIVAAVLVAAAAVPAVALAASRPRRGLWTGQLEFVIPKTGNLSLTQVQSPSYCTKYHWKIDKIGMRNGTFSYSKSTSKPSGVHATVKGSFSSSKRVKGTIKIGTCAQKSFSARLQRGY